MSLNKLGLKFDLIGMLGDLEKTLNFRVISLIDEMVLELNSRNFEYASGTFKKKNDRAFGRLYKIQDWFSSLVRLDSQLW